MCIICVKPTGIEDFSTETLKYCWDKNDDGAGFAWFQPANGLWRVHKGFLKYEDFIKEYQLHKFTKDSCSIVHFRVGTAGLKDGGNTHPFPVLDDPAKMRETEFESANIAFHNGVVGKGDEILSDTIHYIRDYLFPLMAIWEDDRVSNLIADTILTKNQSRWLICAGKFYHKYGFWYEKDGRLYSNANYEPWVNPTKAGGAFGKEELPGGGWTVNGRFFYPLGHAPMHNVSYRKAIEKVGLPVGNDWGHGYRDGIAGFWRDNYFTSWEVYIKNRGLVHPPKTTPPPVVVTKKDAISRMCDDILKIFSPGDFLKRYSVTIDTARGKRLMAMDWVAFGRDQQALRIMAKRNVKNQLLNEKKVAAAEMGVPVTEVVTALVDDDGSLAWDEGKKKAAELADDLKDMKICPGCFADNSLDDSPFTLGDHLCTSCGCVFTLATGYIHMFDHDIKRKFDAEKQVD